MFQLAIGIPPVLWRISDLYWFTALKLCSGHGWCCRLRIVTTRHVLQGVQCDQRARAVVPLLPIDLDLEISCGWKVIAARLPIGRWWKTCRPVTSSLAGLSDIRRCPPGHCTVVLRDAQYNVDVSTAVRNSHWPLPANCFTACLMSIDLISTDCISWTSDLLHWVLLTLHGYGPWLVTSQIVVGEPMLRPTPSHQLKLVRLR
jgi:hypothetical protein